MDSTESNPNARAFEGAALVTGGARRIGRSIALTLAQRGFDLALHYHSSRQEAEKLRQEIATTGRSCRLFPCDFDNPGEVSSLIHSVFESFPHCNLLVHNASLFESASLVETDEDTFDRHFNVNFRAPFFLSRDFALRCQSGHIINVLDSRIVRRHSHYFVYTLSKKALGEFTRMAAHELAPRIRVNGICPGLILPPAGKDEGYLQRLSTGIPMGRKGDLGNVTSALLFLLDNSFVTGECIFVERGVNTYSKDSSMILRIKNLRLRTIIGVNDWERKEKQDVVINVEMELAAHEAVESDRIESTLDYKTLTKRIIREVEQSNYYLLEKLAHHILQTVLGERRVKRATVEVDKPSALRFADSVSAYCSAEARTNRVAIGLGSNIDPPANIEKARELIRGRHRVVGESRFVETLPLGRANQPTFLNGALLVETSMDLDEFKRWLTGVEEQLGRKRDRDKDDPLTIDLDILVWNGEIVDADVHQRAFLRDAIREVLRDLPLDP